MKSSFLTTSILVCFALLCSTGHAQGVYKWVDAEGKTHYGSQPPLQDKGSEPVKLRNSNNSFGGDNYSAARKPVEYNADGTKKIPKDVQELGAGIVKGLKKVDPTNEPLNCNKAVENVRDQFDLMLKAGEKNLKDGYLSQANFDVTAPKIRQARSEVTATDCQSATGAKKSFYQCMSNDRNHISGCGSKYKF